MDQSLPGLGAHSRQLAILGGVPAFSEQLYVGRPNIGDRERFLERMTDILDTRWLSNDGKYVKEFERRVADLLGVAHCVAVCNATVGLELAVRAMGMAGEVIIPSFTFVATAHALQWQGIRPVFCDIDPRSHCIDPARVEELITPITSGIIGVHLWGRACAVDELTEIAGRRKLPLLFDAAHAFGSSHRGHMVGNFGGAEVLSFHATKFCNTFEGGAVVTNDAELGRKLRLMKNFGFEDYDRVTYIGTNGKMSEVSGAMGVTSLESMGEFIDRNLSNYHQYRRGLANIPGIQVFDYDPGERNNYQYVVLEVERAEAGLSRDELLKVLHAENVIARRYFFPGCHRMEPYRSFYPHSHLLLPETERLCERVLLLPSGTAVDERVIADICEVIRSAIVSAKSLAAYFDSEKLRQQVG